MADPSLQLLVHGENISQATVLIDRPGLFLEEVRQTDNPNYLFLDLVVEPDAQAGTYTMVDLVVEPDAQAGTYTMVFEYQREIMGTYKYELKERKPGSRNRLGFSSEDVIYLIMPDRFANGDPENDDVEGMLEKINRGNPDGRHGGDLAGITERLDYLDELGVTTIWLNPVLENNMPAYSYHGYAITDFYSVDPRFGGDKAYLEFIEAAHNKDMKVIMDMVFNHCGSYHWWMDDLPAENWIHQFPEFTRSNYRSETHMDPYAADHDREKMLTGWFDKTMPDLDQTNEFLANYLIQNSIWWIEHAGLDGIRMDTYPYSDKAFMVNWIRRIRLEYPHFNVVGETWLQKESHTAYWMDEARNSDGYDSDLPSITDFPMHYALIQAFTEEDGWTTGLSRLYYILSQDFIYPDPGRTVIFPDNHDLTRYFTSIGENLDRWKMAMTFLLTTRGIPMIYYGTEFLMTGEESDGHGFIRQDFPLWDEQQLDSWTVGQLDKVVYTVVSKKEEVTRKKSDGEKQFNNITIEQLNKRALEAHSYIKALLNWRKDNPVIHHGMLKQFVPEDGVYVYFRYDERNTTMVVMNNNKEEKNFSWNRFAEATKGFTKAKNIIDDREVVIGDEFLILPMTAIIYELAK
jgi:glycosidase